jgi:hypothetical protein
MGAQYRQKLGPAAETRRDTRRLDQPHQGINQRTFPVDFKYALKALMKSFAGTSFTPFPVYVVVTSMVQEFQSAEGKSMPCVSRLAC